MSVPAQDFGPLFTIETPADRAFREFHEANPDVYDMLVSLARRAVSRGKRKLGIRMLWERLRWELTVEVAQQSGDYRLNDHLTSRYARLIRQREPDLAHLFDLRELRS